MRKREQWGIKRCSDLWKKILRLDEEFRPGLARLSTISKNIDIEEWEKQIYNETGVRRDLFALYDPKLGLGWQMRWNLCAFELKRQFILRRHAKERQPITRLKKMCKFQTDFFCLGSLHSIRTDADIAIRKKGLTEQSKNNQQNLRDMLNEYFCQEYARQGAGHSITKEMIFETSFYGESAPENFLRMIRSGIKPLQSNRQLIGERKFESSPARDSKIEELENIIEGPNNGKPIVCFHSTGSHHGLDAFAFHWSTVPDRLGRQKIVIPTGPQTHPHVHRGLGYLVSCLLTFLEGDDLQGAPRPLSQAAINEGILKIRERLARQPVIVIFAGHEVLRGHSATLRRAIIDEPLTTLLAHLVHPIVGKGDKLEDIRNFESSYFVVLADGPLTALSAYMKANLQLPQPNVDRLPPILERDNYRETKHICASVQVLQQQGVYRLPHEIEIDAIEQLRRMERARGKHESDLSCLHDLVKPGDSSLLFQTLSGEIRTYSSVTDQLMLSLIACSDTGMRRATLWSATAIATSALALKYEETQMTRDKFIDGFLARYSNLLYEAEGEITPATPTSLPHRQDNLTLHFRHGKFREKFLKHGIDDSTRRLLYRVLCGIALQQHVEIFRSSDPSERVTVRGYRLAFEALYYGLSALLAPHSEVSKDHWLAQINPLLPNDPIAFFSYLYFDLFARVVEAQSVHRMSRQWASDDLKLAILLLAHRAFSGEDQVDLEKLPRWHKLLGAENIAMLLRRHYEAIGVSAYRAGDLEAMALYSQFTGGPVAAQSPSAALAHRLDALGLSSNIDNFPVLQRIQLDIAGITSGRQAGLDASWTWLEKQFNFPRSKVIDSRAPWAALSADTSWYTLSPSNLCAFIDEHLIQFDTQNPPPLSVWMNLLVRIAEYQYEHAVLSPENSRERQRALLEALAAVIAAQRCCVLDAKRRPYDRVSALPAKGQRIAARVAMALLIELNDDGRRRPVSDDPRRQMWADFLQGLVSTALDQYTLHSHSFAPDQVSALLLNARYQRMLGKIWLSSGNEATPQRAKKHCEMALDIISTAETHLIRFHSRPRLRLRLLGERCATLRNLAYAIVKTGTNDLTQAHRAASLAKYELIQLKNLTSSLFDEKTQNAGLFWHDIVNVERKKMKLLFETLESLDAQQKSTRI